MRGRVIVAVGIVVCAAACGMPELGSDRAIADVPPRSAKLTIDAASDAESDDASVEEAPDGSSGTQTIAIGSNDCGGGHCNGGYDDEKDLGHLPTATKQCQDNGYARATDFMIGGEPGGRFCDFEGSGYTCDESCDGCNVMLMVICTTP